MKLTSYIKSYECPQKTIEGALELFEMCKDMDFIVPGKIGMGTVDKTIKDMIHNEKSENEINEYVFKNTPSINSSCSNLLIEGITSCDELIRSNNIKEDAFV